MDRGLYASDRGTVVFAYHVDASCCAERDSKSLYNQVLPARSGTFEVAVREFEKRYPHPVVGVRLAPGPKVPRVEATPGLYTDGETVVWAFRDALVYSFAFGEKIKPAQRNIHYQEVLPVGSVYEYPVLEESMFLVTFPYLVTELEFT